ncbi:MAG: hypothetical protein ACLP4W_30085 [Mycobacterium sp.]|uniref:hypothetical protein n=1 Tax=Mycobacterium sp. TaxID=1785 RepID=UPI003F96073D
MRTGESENAHEPVRGIRHNQMVAAPDPARPAHAQRLVDARKEWGWSQDDLAAEVQKIRAERKYRPSERETLRRQIIEHEKNGKPGKMWRSLLADALREEEDQLFGLVIDVALPRPLLLQMPVDIDVVNLVLAQRAAHIQAEHIFGPAHARDLVDRDLVTIEQLITVTPTALRHDVRRAAGRIAEVGGWIAQDSGDYAKAHRLTSRAADHLRGADPALRAMISMRRSNIVMRDDPDLAVDLAAEAAQLIDGQTVGRLAASIARQQALAAVADHDPTAFRRHAAHALDLAAIEPIPDDHAIYATASYIAGEIAAGYLATGHAETAVALLLAHHQHWPTGQYRDFAVASTRLLRALITQHDYRAATDHLDAAILAYRAAPSDRARHELRQSRKILRDHTRTATNASVLHTLRTRITAALQEATTP